MSFLRHQEIYQSDERQGERARPCSHALAHRLDEFPVGYSLASCSPAELASASPTGLIVSNGPAEGKNFFNGPRECLNFLSHERGSPQSITTRIVSWEGYKGIDDAAKAANVTIITLSILEWFEGRQPQTREG